MREVRTGSTGSIVCQRHVVPMPAATPGSHVFGNRISLAEGKCGLSAGDSAATSPEIRCHAVRPEVHKLELNSESNDWPI